MKPNKFKWLVACVFTCLYFWAAVALPSGWGYGLSAFVLYAVCAYVWWQWAQGKL